MSTPYYLRPKATKLPEGHDDTLDPPEPPTDAEERSAPPSVWPVASTARGGDEPPEGPLAPPPTSSVRRTVPPLEWPVVADAGRLAPDDSVLLRVPPEAPRWKIGPPGRPLPRELVAIGDLDPDIALWPIVIVQRWPFTGPPSVGVWPKGWLGVDNTATVYVCNVGGEPGTWAPLGGQAGPPGPQGPPGPTGATGPQGINGAAAGFGTPTAGSLPPGSQPTVTASGPDTAKIFAFGIPIGLTGATGPAGPQGVPGPTTYPQILRAIIGPGTALSGAVNGALVLGSNGGTFNNIVTQVGHRYRITACTQGFNDSASTATQVGANLQRDGVQLAAVAQFYSAPVNGIFVGTRVWLEDGDGVAGGHIWQVFNATAGGATCHYNVNQTTITVEDLGTNFNTP